MGSGCNTSGCGSTAKCFQRISDQCVIYTGDPIEQLGICTNDTLSEVEAVILQTLLTVLDGTGITIEDADFEKCDFFQQYIACCSADKSLPNIINIIFDAICQLYADIVAIQNVINQIINLTFTSSCLSLTNANLKATIEKILTSLCQAIADIANLTTRFDSLIAGLSSTIGTQIGNSIASCQTGAITITGSGASTVVNFKGFVPVGGIIPYYGTMAYFDTSGLGLTNTPMCGWAIANNNNGTVDMRGFVPVGSINQAGGGALNAIVDPNNNAGLGNYSPGDVGGEIRHTLSAIESGVPVHTHTVDEHGGHFHYMHFGLQTAGTGAGGGNTYMKTDSRDVSSSNPDGGGYIYPNPDRFIGVTINRAETGITINNNTAQAAQQPHENRMPYKALIFIQRIA